MQESRKVQLKWTFFVFLSLALSDQQEYTAKTSTPDPSHTEMVGGGDLITVIMR